MPPFCFGSEKKAPAPTIIQNALELLDEEGEFYVDTTVGTLYYKPRVNEDMTTATVVLPQLETLLNGAGTLDAPVHNLHFSGITFAYAGWNGPAGSDGYIDLQTGVRAITAAPGQAKTPGNITFSAAHDVRFERNVFTHLGAAGFNIDNGSHDNVIIGNKFEDISSSAVIIGDVTHVTDSHPTDLRGVVKNNLLESNLIDDIGVDYVDAAAVFVGYTDSTQIVHNEIYNTPYTGISVGWGWGYYDVGGAGHFTTPTICQNNVVSGNHVSLHMRVQRDGGGVYTLGAQPNSTIEGNLIENQGAVFGAIYLDNGTQHYTATGNVLRHNPYYGLVQPGVPLARNNAFIHNFADVGQLYHQADVDGSNRIGGNVVGVSHWTPTASSIITQAGLEPTYADLYVPDVAVRKTTTASSTWSAARAPATANDDYARTGWSSAKTDEAPWWEVDLGQAYLVSSFDLVTLWDIDQPTARRNFEVEGSNDPSFATFEVLAEQGAATLPLHAIWSAPATSTTRYRYIRVSKTASELFGFAEFRVHATP